MDINKLEIEGYRSYGERQVIDFSQPGLVLLTGDNRDRGISSGSGKSTIFKAICTVLFEECDDNSIKGHGINTLRPEMGCRIGLHFTDDLGVPFYAVYAYRHPEDKTDWYIWRWDGEKWMDMREEKKGDTKAVIHDIIHMDYSQFVNRAYMAQETVAEFIWRTHAQRLEIFSGILDLGVVDNWTQSARDWRRETEKELTAGQGKLSAYASQLVKLKALVIPDSAIQQYQGEIEDLSIEAGNLQAQIEERQASLRQVSALVDLRVKIATLKKEADNLTDLQEKYHLSNQQSLSQVCAAEKLPELKTQLEELVLRHREAWSNHAQAKKRLEAIRRLGNKCDSCEQPISQKTHASLVEKWESAMKDAEAKERTLAEAKSATQVEHDRNYQEWNAIKGREKEILDLQRCYREVFAKLVFHEKQMVDIREVLGEAVDYPQQLNDEIKELQGRKDSVILSKMNKESALREAFAAIRQYEDLQKQHADQEKENADFSQQITQLKKVESLLGDKGFKAYKINSSRTAFNNSLNKYLSVLSDGDIEAELVTEVPKADGKGVKSELDILVRDGLKSKVPIKQYSGGEKAAISLAITGAFWDLASQQSSGAVNVLLLDEPFGGADAYGEEKACRLFESMRESGRVIFVVTNRQGVRERGKFDREVRAVKENHISHIEQYDLSGEH